MKARRGFDPQEIRDLVASCRRRARMALKKLDVTRLPGAKKILAQSLAGFYGFAYAVGERVGRNCLSKPTAKTKH
jgi:hypothetical protein